MVNLGETDSRETDSPKAAASKDLDHASWGDETGGTPRARANSTAGRRTRSELRRGHFRAGVEQGRAQPAEARGAPALGRRPDPSADRYHTKLEVRSQAAAAVEAVWADPSAGSPPHTMGDEARPESRNT